MEWIKDIEETSGHKVNFPIIADEKREVAALYGMINPNAPDTLQGKLTVRSLFIINPDKSVSSSFPLLIFQETLVEYHVPCLHWTQLQ